MAVFEFADGAGLERGTENDLDLDLAAFFRRPCFGEHTEQLSSEHELTLSLPEPDGLRGREPDGFDETGFDGGV